VSSGRERREEERERESERERFAGEERKAEKRREYFCVSSVELRIPTRSPTEKRARIARRRRRRRECGQFDF